MWEGSKKRQLGTSHCYVLLVDRREGPACQLQHLSENKLSPRVSPSCFMTAHLSNKHHSELEVNDMIITCDPVNHLHPKPEYGDTYWTAIV